MSFSPFDHPVLSGLLGDEETARHFSAEAEIAAMLVFERALAEAAADEGVIDTDAAAAIAAALNTFKPNMAGLKAGVGQDGVIVPELVRQLRSAIGKPHDKALHFGATSQDVIDTGLILRLKHVIAHLDAVLADVVELLAGIEARFGDRALMGRTRMQAAIPITVSDRVRAWREPLLRHRSRLETQSRGLLVVQFGGAAGTLEKLGDKANAVRAALAGKLGLGDAPQWHSQRDRLAEFASLLSLISGSLGKFGQDVALMAQAGSEIALKGGGGSSAMPHKQNPVAAEVLVTLARFNATQLSGMHQALVHEQERSGAAWTLEWLILPQMVAATVASLRQAKTLAGQIEAIGT
ncbi:3-carboxy-cis,cis-muconate cycloisomerase [Pseudaminobacter salicylatoxidans]|uniref:3-carboxy-cis,cis-muconate cycloisomerase n=1 Tax=Pseudaminobacter salicylatoxidans TaxID=93369 RepID=A0A316C9Z7_PSESE|nr:3-carboxy-cis,cis-muconate cycloisomerase [Pseudaminobacter salicylatoxidans]PWJ86490.1 3-carboxy-cis,cis-muconate cycloisomerase [Pseudaminobacter salicylatoxidans]